VQPRNTFQFGTSAEGLLTASLSLQQNLMVMVKSFVRRLVQHDRRLVIQRRCPTAPPGKVSSCVAAVAGKLCKKNVRDSCLVQVTITVVICSQGGLSGENACPLYHVEPFHCAILRIGCSRRRNLRWYRHLGALRKMFFSPVLPNEQFCYGTQHGILTHSTTRVSPHHRRSGAH
jgi:hypothetical protein